MKRKKIAVFGSTGQLGRISLELLSLLKNDFEVAGLLCNKNWKLLLEQIEKFKPDYAVVMDEESYRKAKEENRANKTEILFGYEGLKRLCECAGLDMIIFSIIGSCGFAMLLECLPYCKKILLANKESVVLGGDILKEEVRKCGSFLIPIDSEHSCLMRLLNLIDRKYISNVYITASGGPFLNKKEEELENVTPEEALKHPIWNMGARITIDSATLMNKAFEIIEAKYLFDLPPEKIKVLIHPESLFHAFLELEDRTILGLSHKPDMRIPLLYGLYYPDNLDEIPLSVTDKVAFDWSQAKKMEFHNEIKHKSIELAYYAATKGHIFEIALNAADEVAVEHFIQRKIKFTDIVRIVSKVIESLNYESVKTVEEIMNFDKKIKEATVQLCKIY